MKIVTNLVTNAVTNAVTKLPLIKPVLSGLEIGLPINIISKAATDVNFPNSPLTLECILLNCLLGFGAYKQDRYLDAQEYFNEFIFMNNTLDYIYYNSKHNYYSSLVNNKQNVKLIELSLFCAYISICTLAIYYHIGIIFPMFSSTFLYKYLKKNDKISYFKPFYVAGMWTICSCILPQIMYNEINGINEINQLSTIDYNVGYSTFLNLFALTNLADLKDYDEDTINGVNTLPIILGESKIKSIILGSVLLSAFLFITSEYYIDNLQNLVYMSCNIFPVLPLINFTIF